MSTAAIDWAAEGLLDGLEGEARHARSRLLDALAADGVTTGQLRRAVADDQLAALPALMVLGGLPQESAAEAARRTGLDLDFVLAVRRANGVPIVDPRAPVLAQNDLDIGEIVSSALQSGVSEEQVIATARVLGHATRQIAEQMGAVLFELADVSGQDEQQVADRLARWLSRLEPLTGEVVRASMRVHMREAVKDAVTAAALSASPDDPPGTRTVAVAFADLVGFTRLGEELSADDLERVANRLSELVSEAVVPPVRFVKTIGDAAMLVSPDPAALVTSVLDLVDAADAAGAAFPQLRAGITWGPALARGGDWFGRPVNLASRLTGMARAGSVLVTRDLRDAVGDERLRWSSVGPKRVRGVTEPVVLYRVRRAAPSGAPQT